MSVNIDEQLFDKKQIDLLDSVLTDLTALRGAIVAITAKLDADAGVTDTNYASTCDPAALNTVSS